MAKPAECIFCKIVEGKAEARKIYEDESNIAILDVNPRFGEGQCLVIPKKHVEQFYELDDEDLFKLFKAVKAVALKIKKVYNPDFVALFSRGMGIPHVHIFVVPSYRHDVFITSYMLLTLQRRFDSGIKPEKLDKIAEKLRNA